MQIGLGGSKPKEMPSLCGSSELFSHYFRFGVLFGTPQKILERVSLTDLLHGIMYA